MYELSKSLWRFRASAIGKAALACLFGSLAIAFTLDCGGYLERIDTIKSVMSLYDAKK